MWNPPSLLSPSCPLLTSPPCEPFNTSNSVCTWAFCTHCHIVPWLFSTVFVWLYFLYSVISQTWYNIKLDMTEHACNNNNSKHLASVTQIGQTLLLAPGTVISLNPQMHSSSILQMRTLRLREGKYCLSATLPSLCRTWPVPEPGSGSSLPSLSGRHTSHLLGKWHQPASPPSRGLGAQVPRCWDVSFHGPVVECNISAFSCPSPGALSDCTSRMVRIIGWRDGGPDIWKAVSAYT